MNVQADVFPAKVVITTASALTEETFPLFHVGGTLPTDTRKLDRCRIIVANNQIVIAVDAPIEGAKIVFQEAVALFTKGNKRFQVTTVSGKVLAFQYDPNCGCGSRLKSWAPYGNILTAQSSEE